MQENEMQYVKSSSPWTHYLLFPPCFCIKWHHLIQLDKACNKIFRLSELFFQVVPILRAFTWIFQAQNWFLQSSQHHMNAAEANRFVIRVDRISDFHYTIIGPKEFAITILWQYLYNSLFMVHFVYFLAMNNTQNTTVGSWRESL